MAKGYKQPKNLVEVLADRKSFYLAKVNEAFDRAYASGDFAYITRFENSVMALGARDAEGELESIAEKAVAEKRTRKRRRKANVDKRPKLTAYQYAKARDAGKTNAQIKKEYRMTSPYQICGFGSVYAQRIVGKKK
jgi:hypothetical protein